MHSSNQEKISRPLMELFIETLTGTSIILHVSPLDTVLDVKTYIQKMEGIPASHQHLVWHSSELMNEQLLQDSSIYSGATLRLVVSMQGGPVNTRRVPAEEPTLAEYFTEANRSDLLPSATNRHRPVTVVVCQSGDHLRFYQLMPGTDVSSPLSCAQSLSEDDVDTDKELLTTNKRREENRRTRDKMKLVRSQMERCTLLKEKRDQMPLTESLLPRPPSTGQPVFMNRLRHMPSSRTAVKPAVLDVDRKPCTLSSAVSIVTSQTSTQPSNHLEHVLEKEMLSLQNAGTDTSSVGEIAAVEKHGQEHEVPETIVKSTSISCLAVSGDPTPSEAESRHVIKDNVCGQSEICKPKTASAHHRVAVVESTALSVSRGSTKPVNKQAKSTPEVHPTHDGKSMSSASWSQHDQLRSCSQGQLDDVGGKFAGPVAAAAPVGHPAPAALKRVRARNEGSVTLRSLDSRDTRIVSGLLTSLVRDRGSRLSSGSCYQLVRTGKSSSSLRNKPRQTSPSKPVAVLPAKCMEDAAETTDSSSEASSARHIPTISAPKTLTNRCLVCNKRTSLATSFQCRCGGNFCSVHRNAEAHGCRFDYKTEGRCLLEQNNPVVAAEKLPKI